ncbi:MAG: glycine cleavage system protein H [Desulfovibrio sp.]|nr:glycine cleavage system protein H [Desulfovibrio sp.]
MNTKELLQILACPKCLGSLQAMMEQNSLAGLACQTCKALYPVRNDIPVMLVEEALNLDQWRRDHPAAEEQH